MKIALIVLTLVLTGCSREPTQEEAWVIEQDKKCIAAKGRGAYDKIAKEYECWQKPAFRRPKLVFTEKYI